MVFGSVEMNWVRDPAAYALHLNPWLLDQHDSLTDEYTAKDILACITYAIVIHEIAHHMQLRLFTYSELQEQLREGGADVGEEVERLIFGGVIRSNLSLTALHIQDRFGKTYDVDPKVFREYFIGDPMPKIDFETWNITRFPVVSKDETMIGMAELNGTHGDRRLTMEEMVIGCVKRRDPRSED